MSIPFHIPEVQAALDARAAATVQHAALKAEVERAMEVLAVAKAAYARAMKPSDDALKAAKELESRTLGGWQRTTYGSFLRYAIAHYGVDATWTPRAWLRQVSSHDATKTCWTLDTPRNRSEGTPHAYPLGECQNRRGPLITAAEIIAYQEAADEKLREAGYHLTDIIQPFRS